MGAYTQTFLQSFNQTHSFIKQAPWRSAALLLIQLFLLLSIAGIIIGSSLAIAQDVQRITDPLTQVSDEELFNASEQDILRQTAAMYSGYISLIKHLILYTILSIASIMVFAGWLWVVTNNVAEKSKTSVKQLFIYWRRFIERTLLFVIPYVALTIGTIIILVEKSVTVFITGLIVMDIILVIATYFYLISSATLSTNTWKKFIYSLKYLGVNHAKHLIPTVLVAAAAIALVGYLLYLTVMVFEIFPLMILVVVLLTALLVYTRIYLTTLIKVESQKEHSA